MAPKGSLSLWERAGGEGTKTRDRPHRGTTLVSPRALRHSHKSSTAGQASSGTQVGAGFIPSPTSAFTGPEGALHISPRQRPGSPLCWGLRAYSRMLV
jgi:hypothetical protein